MSNGAYVGIEPLATYLGVSISTIRQWVRDGKIPKTSYIKIGITYRFHLRAVEDALISYKSKKGMTDKERDQQALDIIRSLDVSITESKPTNISADKLRAAEAELADKVRGVPHFKGDAELDEELDSLSDELKDL